MGIKYASNKRGGPYNSTAVVRKLKISSFNVIKTAKGSADEGKESMGKPSVGKLIVGDGRFEDLSCGGQS